MRFLPLLIVLLAFVSEGQVGSQTIKQILCVGLSGRSFVDFAKTHGIYQVQ